MNNLPQLGSSHRPRSKAPGISSTSLQASALRRNPREPSSSRLAKVEIPDFPPTTSKNPKAQEPAGTGNEAESIRSRNPHYDPSDLDDDERLKKSKRNNYMNSRDSHESSNGSPGLPVQKKWAKEHSTPISKQPKLKINTQKDLNDSLDDQSPIRNSDQHIKQDKQWQHGGSSSTKHGITKNKTKNQLYSAQKLHALQVPQLDDLKGGRISNQKLPGLNSNRFDMVSNKGPMSIKSNRSRGPSVNDILAQSAKSIKNQRSALANRQLRGAPERSASKGFTGLIGAKKVDEDLPDMGARRAQQPNQKQNREGDKSRENGQSAQKQNALLNYQRDDDVQSSHSSTHYTPAKNPMDTAKLAEAKTPTLESQQKAKLKASPAIQIPDYQPASHTRTRIRQGQQQPNAATRSKVPARNNSQLDQLEQLPKEKPKKHPYDDLSEGSGAATPPYQQHTKKEMLMRPTTLISSESHRSKQNNYGPPELKQAYNPAARHNPQNAVLNQTGAQQSTFSYQKILTNTLDDLSKRMSGYFNPTGLTTNKQQLTEQKSPPMPSEAIQQKEQPKGMVLDFNSLSKNPIDDKSNASHSRKESVGKRSSKSKGKKQNRSNENISLKKASYDNPQMFNGQANSFKGGNSEVNKSLQSIGQLLQGRNRNNQSSQSNVQQPVHHSAQFVKEVSPGHLTAEISDEDQIYFEIIYLLEQIEDPDECYFYDQLETIRDKFKIVEKEKITQYFDKLVIVVEQDDNESIRKLHAQIKKIYDLLKAYSPLERMTYASAPRGKKEFESIDNMKPSRADSDSIGEISDDEPLPKISAQDNSDQNIFKQSHSVEVTERNIDKKYLLANASSLDTNQIKEQRPEHSFTADNKALGNIQSFNEVQVPAPVPEPVPAQKVVQPYQQTEEKKSARNTQLSMKNTLEKQIEDVKRKLQEEVELEAIRQKQEKALQLENFKAICEETRQKYQHIFEKIQEAEVKTFGEENRESISDAALLNNTDQLYAKFNEQKIDPSQMKEFVQYQYLKVLEQRKQRYDERRKALSEELQAKQKESDQRIAKKLTKIEDQKNESAKQLAESQNVQSTPGGVMELTSKNEFGYGAGGPSPKNNNNQDSTAMKVIPMNLAARQSPEQPRSPERQGQLVNQKLYNSAQHNKEDAAAANAQKPKNIFGKKRDQSVPLNQRQTGAQRLINKIGQVKDGGEKDKKYKK